MAEKKNRLELNWIGKDIRPRLEPRILIEDPELSYHAPKRITDNDIFENRLIYGDNLLALKALEHEFTGKIKCIYIDPPYNTGQAFEHYDDGLEHSVWLTLMRDRLELLRNLLTPDGTLFCQLNDDEMAYGKVLLDEILGRSNFLNQISVRMKQNAGASGGGEDKRLKKNIEYILIYAKDSQQFVRFGDVFEEERLMDLIEEMRDEGKSWKYTRVLINFGIREYLKTVQDASGNDIEIYEQKGVEIKTIKELMNEQGLTEEQVYFKYFDLIFRDTNAQSSIRTRVMEATEKAEDFISIDYFPRSGRSKGQKTTLYYRGRNRDLIAWLKDVAKKKHNTIIKYERVGTYWEGFPLNNLTKEGDVRFPQGKKPEALIQRIIELATEPGDIILDSFLGSGTTAAVAQKMGRRWIGIELGEHMFSHCIPRLQRVINGTDTGGVTRDLNWNGGGGFRFLRLAPSLLEKDKWGNWIVTKDYKPEMLAEAVCKLEGFHYAPNPEIFWIHGHSTETDYIYVTTQNLSYEQLRFLSDQVGSKRTLLICCGAFRAKKDEFPNLTMKKIPQAVLTRCEWGQDDYSLNVENLSPVQQLEKANNAENTNAIEDTKVNGRRKKGAVMQDLPLFAYLEREKSKK